MHLRHSQRYTGESKVVIALDIGTTFCAISYVILEKGFIPEVKGVTRFPFQHLVNGGFKIPSIAYYDEQGRLCAIGAAALDDNVIEQAEQNGWFKSHWFKLHGKSSPQSEMIPLLPPKQNGPVHLCRFTGSRSEYVISHPNGWAGAEQQMLRQAAVQAGLIDNVHSEQIHFITEGEASLHFCLASMPGLSNIPVEFSVIVGKTLLVVDAGGGTVDLSSYNRISESGLYAGSVFVNRRAEEYFNERLRGTDFEADIPIICEKFNDKTKIGFANPIQPHFIRFSSRGEDKRLDITGGQLKIAGAVIADFFQDSLGKITNAIVRQILQHGNDLFAILLVGGYAASPYLTFKIQELFHANVGVLRPNENASKAVADGSLLHYLENQVTSRISRYALGTNVFRDYDPRNPEHVRHSELITVSPTGKKEISRMFDVIIEKGTRVRATEEYRTRYWKEKPNVSELSTVEVEIIAYDGQGSAPQFMDDEPENFPVLCTLVADMREACKELLPHTHQRKKYYRLDYDIILILGLTELKAQGKEIRTPAQIFFTPE
ncbi:hypothetical protein BT96DRAFT_995850 [Gymnopus androsaceus JB14]|uniref:Actin-like ATPase domain-containing protein n=1 Tax=Gymnopus androsaceus JB14 TaxID=1447944 RepID=A0A6A4HI77_9AGAR|nr:hypothetical protein BT96DRAFT_995850 [Gymnopus androsaceus JB14]